MFFVCVLWSVCSTDTVVFNYIVAFLSGPNFTQLFCVIMAEGLRNPAELSFEGNVAQNWNILVKAYTLLNLAGPEAIKRARNFEYKDEVKDGDRIIQEKEAKDDVKVLLKKFRELCNPQNNVSMERPIFFIRDQKQGESVDAYVTDLKLKAKTCEFGNLKDELIRDRFISGVVSEQLRRVLLKECNLTLKRAIEIGQLDEITQARLKQFKRDKDIHLVDKRLPSSSLGSQRCGNCGGPHNKSDKCPAKGKQCNQCKKSNHFSKVCRGYKKNHSEQHVPQPTQQKSRTRFGKSMNVTWKRLMMKVILS